MMYRLKKDLNGLKQGTELHYVKGVFVHENCAFDPLDVISDEEHFEEVSISQSVQAYSEVETI